MMSGKTVGKEGYESIRTEVGDGSSSLSQAIDAIAEFTEAVALIEAAVAQIDQHTELAKQSLSEYAAQLLINMKGQVMTIVNGAVALAVADVRAVISALGGTPKSDDSFEDSQRMGGYKQPDS